MQPTTKATVGQRRIDVMTHDLTADRARLAELIRQLAVVHGKVTLSSGKEADYYIDLRRITLHHGAAPPVGRGLLGLLDEAGIQFEAAGGLPMGAAPAGTAVMHAAGDRGIDAFVVRKTQKVHGLARQVEGPGVDGRKVVILEDTSTTGGSALAAVDGVRRAGGDIQAVAVIVDRDTGAAEHVAEQAGVPYLYAFSKTDLGLTD